MCTGRSWTRCWRDQGPFLPAVSQSSVSRTFHSCRRPGWFARTSSATIAHALMTALSSGTSLGPYTIVAPLGAGGMGEVYRAMDTRLKRQVAIKVLPSTLATDPERLGRFQREAEVLASLN